MDRRGNNNQELSNAIRLGVIAMVDLQRKRCRVETGGITTDLVPWFVPRAGKTIEWSAPSVGEQVMLISANGDISNAVALRGLYSDVFMAPSESASEHVVVHADGAVIKYDHDAHALTAILPPGGTVSITADGGLTINASAGVTINAPLTVNGNVTVDGTATTTGDVVADGVSLTKHPHKNVQPGNGQSGPPA